MIGGTLTVEVESGDVPARPSGVCSHGVAGYCYDDALPEEREAVEFLFQSGFDYALGATKDRDVAERYGAWLVADSWHPGVVVMEGSHPRDFARFTEE